MSARLGTSPEQTPVAAMVCSLADMSSDTLSDVRSLGDLVQRFAEPMARLCAGPAAEQRRYRRSLLYRTDRFELLLLRWGAGAMSPVHDHARQTCVFTVLSGALTVDDFALEATAANHTLLYHVKADTITPGLLDSRKGELDIHRVSCAVDAVSLHVYAAPIERCTVYSLDTPQRSMKRLTYDDIRVDLLSLA